MLRTEIIEIKVSISTEYISLILLPKDERIELNNICLMNTQTNQVIAVGITTENYAEKFPKSWKKIHSKIMPLPIFNITNFAPEIASSIIYEFWFFNRVYKKIFPKKECLTISIDFSDYESLPNKKQEEFEFALIKHTFAKKLIVNNQERVWSLNKIRFAHVSLIFAILSFGLSSTIVSVIPFIKTLDLLGVEQTMSLSFGLILFFSLLMGLFFYIGAMLGISIWMIFLHSFFPRKILINSLLYHYPKTRAKLGQLTNFLVNSLLKEK